MPDRAIFKCCAALIPAIWSLGCTIVSSQDSLDSKSQSFLDKHCFACHGYGAAKGDLALDELLKDSIALHTAKWESVVRKMATRQMPPPSEDRPEEAAVEQVLFGLVNRLDILSAEHPYPGRTETFRRLTRAEYQNAVRDLLAVEVDVAELLPSDDSSHGFDNVTVSNLSPMLLDRYIAAAQKISRLAVGANSDGAAESVYRIAPDITQDGPIPGAPVGSRGGNVFRHYFPQSGEYEVHVLLMRDRNEELEGRPGKYQLEVLLDKARVELLSFERPRGNDDHSIDFRLKARCQVSAGPHEVGAVFLKTTAGLQETVRQPLNVHYNFYRHPRIEPAVYQIAVRGPLGESQSGDTPSRKRLFASNSTGQRDEVATAKQILQTLMRRAYRREPTPADLQSTMKLFELGRADNGFETGIERAIAAILVNPWFLFRIEQTPEFISSGAPFAVTPVELATRLSFFLWSSIPDDELLEHALAGNLNQTEVLESQVRRMLLDDRAKSLIRNFAAQWLHLRNLASFIPDMRVYPDFDDNLRQAMRTETELLVGSVVSEDRSVLDLIDSHDTFLNERLAKHYGIPHVFGARFRRVALDKDSQRGGLLRQGSILCVTSYANRTSPVLRGKWVLENLLGSPPPPPPPNVPALDDGAVISSKLTVRDRLQQHRANPACAACHDAIDPVGFALERFDGVGRWRDVENDRPIDCSVKLPDGTQLTGPASLERLLLDRPETFARAFTEKLMTFALGRGLDDADGPAVRRVVREAQQNNYRFSSVVLGIVRSIPFQMRTAE